jgi:hypothetical protein
VSVPSTTNSATPIDGIVIFPMASPGSGCFSRTLRGGLARASSSSACWRCAKNHETGSCHSRVTPASVMRSAPLTIITDATKRKMALTALSLGAAGYASAA